MKWRVISLKSFPGPLNMALDEAIAEAVRAKDQLPTIRFYGWTRPTISLGLHQQVKGDIDLKECAAYRVQIVRRPTGGSAVVHLPTDLTYSVMVRDDDLPPPLRGTIKACYTHFCQYIVRALQHEPMNLPAELHPESPNDIRVHGRKISGNAQVRLSNDQGTVFLQHGTLLYDYDESLLRKLLPVKHPGKVGWVRQWRSMSREEVYGVLLEEFTRDKHWDPGFVSPQEMDRAAALVREKYGTGSWTFSTGTVCQGSCYDHAGRAENE